MDIEFEKKYHELEREHFWFKERRNLIKDILERNDISNSARILDIGCSSGILLEELAAKGFDTANLFGVDISEKAIQNCQDNGFRNTFVMDAQDITLDQKFDVLIASDCLEHLADDKKALSSWTNRLNEGGLLIVFVPAYMFLWSQHDIANHHFRRYTKKELVQKILARGLHVKKEGYWNFFLFFSTAVVRVLSRLIPERVNEETSSDLKKVRFNSFFSSILKMENSFIRRISFPFGVSTYCIAFKEK